MTDVLPPIDDTAVLRAYLASRDVGCPLCGYNLRALKGSACPECGHELIFKIDLADPVRGAYVAGLIGLATGLGFNGLLGLLIFTMSAIFNDWAPAGLFLYFTIITFVSLGLVIGWARHAAVIRRQPKHVRAMLVVAAWMLPTVSLVMVCIIIAVMA